MGQPPARTERTNGRNPRREGLHDYEYTGRTREGCRGWGRAAAETACYAAFAMQLVLEVEQETDGRWLAEVVDLPGVLVYGPTADAAAAAAKALSLRVLADRIDHGELAPADLDSVSFVQREPLAV